MSCSTPIPPTVVDYKRRLLSASTNTDLSALIDDCLLSFSVVSAPVQKLICQIILQNSLLFPDKQTELTAAILTRLEYRYRLSSKVLDYPTSVNHVYANLETNPLHKSYVRCFDEALPSISYNFFAQNFNAQSRYWSDHNYNDGRDPELPATPYFSYVIPVSDLKKDSFTSALAEIFELCKSQIPSLSSCSKVEFWAHKRPHSSGHQLHFDSDNEGDDLVVKHPTASAVLYLTDDVGGPTLVTPQRTTSRKVAKEGWLVFPKQNRLCVFNGSVLHGVVPGKGVCGGGERITLMFAFWDDVRVREKKGIPCAAMSYPEDGLVDENGKTSKIIQQQHSEEVVPIEVVPIEIDEIFCDVDSALNKKERRALRREKSVPCYEEVFQF